MIVTMNTVTKLMSLRIKTDLATRVAICAQQENRTVSNMITQLLIEALDGRAGRKTA
jgi:hypothetical protein